MTTFSLSKEQKEFYDLLESTNENYFVTGNAGTGKSCLIQYFLEHTKKRTAVVAPTGMAALNAGGVTIHSFFGLDTNVQDPTDPKDLYRGLNEKVTDNLTTIDTLVIDEVSMVRVDVMDMIDARLRVARDKKDLPFGGCQLICFGDLYQLPPVLGRSIEVRNFLYDVYHTIFFFGAPVFYEKPIKTLTLTHVFRQKDPVFTKLLNSVRIGDNRLDIVDGINKCRPAGSNTECLTLTPTNAAAREINLEKLESIKEQGAMIYNGLIEGDFEKDEIPTEEPLVLKVGAQVMFVKNNAKDKLWVNGTIGKVISLTDNMIQVYIEEKNITCSVEKETWTKYKYICQQDKETGKKTIERTPIGYFTQFPLKLAYAITIHKAQGKTLEAVNIDYSNGRAFDAGQTYVALSRCKSMEKLYLATPLIPSDIKVHQEVIAFMNGEYEMKPVQRKPLPEPIKNISHSSAPSFEWTEDNRIKVITSRRPKKITGTRMSAIFGLNKFKSPFEVWCALQRLYEAPFMGSQKKVEAGKLIESKQFEYIKHFMAKDGRHFISAVDIYGKDVLNKTHGDFFKFTEIFGGMWDCILKSSTVDKSGEEKLVAVFEMKTTGIKNKDAWSHRYPTEYEMQGALYAYLLGVKYYYMVTSFLTEDDYQNPDTFVCTEKNTLILTRKLPPNFYENYIVPATKWWNQYVETKISPQYNPIKDKKIIEELKKRTEEQEQTINKQNEIIRKQESELDNFKEFVTLELRKVRSDLSESQVKYDKTIKIFEEITKKAIAADPIKYRTYEDKLTKDYGHLSQQALQFIASGELLYELLGKENFEGVNYSPVINAYSNGVEDLLRNVLQKKNIPIPMINNKRSATIGVIINECVFAKAYRNCFEDGFGTLLRDFNKKFRVNAAHAGVIDKQMMEDARCYLFNGNENINKGLLTFFNELFS